MRALLFCGVLALTTAVQAFAGGETATSGKKEVAPADEFPFTWGSKELEVGVGGFGSLGTKGTGERPDVTLVLGQIRYGMMLSNPLGSGLLRGNVEGLLEAYGAGIAEGPGDEIIGAGFILRWNFVQPNAHIVPFIQIEGGGAYSDMAEDDAVQHLLGQDFSFTFGGEVGLRWMVSRRFSITGGVEYRHTSNADMADRNRGLNVLGGTIGASFFF